MSGEASARSFDPRIIGALIVAAILVYLVAWLRR